MAAVDRSSLSPLVWLGIGAGGALVGLLPWLITGARLPLQNLGEAGTLDMPIALLPLNQYFLGTIVALIVVGSAASGLAARILAERRPPGGTRALVGGTLGVQLIAIIQSVVVTVGVLEQSVRASLYLALLVAVCAVAFAVGVLVLLLVARAPVPGAAIALSMTAVVSGSWLGIALRELFLYNPSGLSPLADGLLMTLRWMPAVLVGAVIAWCGFRTVGRVVAVVVSVAALWIGPAFFTGVGNAAGSRILARNPLEMLDYGVGVFWMALGLVEVVLPTLAVALAIGVIGGVALDVAGRRRRAETTREPVAEPVAERTADTPRTQ